MKPKNGAPTQVQPRFKPTPIRTEPKPVPVKRGFFGYKYTHDLLAGAGTVILMACVIMGAFLLIRATEPERISTVVQPMPCRQGQVQVWEAYPYKSICVDSQTYVDAVEARSG